MSGLSRPQYKILLYSLDGRLLSAYCAYEWSLGIKSVAWSPSSQFLAVGSYDGKVGRAPARSEPRGPAHAASGLTGVVLPSGAHSESRDMEGDHRVWASCNH